MSDIVNEYFKRFYPANWKDRTQFEYESYLGGMWRYKDRSVRTIFPAIKCADGLTMSVQGHNGGYCLPRDDFAETYGAVEIMAAKKLDPLLAEYERECNAVGDDEMIYPYVPVSVVAELIAKHGGLASDDALKLPTKEE